MKTFQDWDWPPTCLLCRATTGLQGHHKVYRSRGGSDLETNIAVLCIVCHSAVHGIAAVLDGHSCRTCAVLAKYGCHFGELVTGRRRSDGTLTPPPWDGRIEEISGP